MIQARPRTVLLQGLVRQGRKVDQRKFHDFILAQRLLPADLMRKAVMEEFVPAQH